MLFKIGFSIILLVICVVKCSENKEEIEYENITNDNESEDNESVESNNSTEDYDYNGLLSDGEDNSDCNQESVIEKVKLIHEKGRNATLVKNVKHINETFNIIENLQNVLSSMFSSDGRSQLEILELLSDIDFSLSHDCITSLFTIVTNLRKYEFWALKFIDSMGRFPPPGFAEGIQSSFGEYDECLNIESPPNNQNNGPIIKGKYCLLKVILPYPSTQSYREGELVKRINGSDLNFAKQYNLKKLQSIRNLIEVLNQSKGTIYRLGICIPSVCRAHEIEEAFNKIIYPITKIPLEVGPKCHTKDQKVQFDYFQLFSITMLSILTILIILSTGLEICKNHINPKVLSKSVLNEDILLSFSIIKNTQLLLAPNTRFAALDTIRLLFIINVHIANLYQYTTSIGLISLKKVFSEVMFKVYEDNKYVFARTPLMIDGLFALSGFLLSYGLLKKLEKTKGRFNYFGFLFNRWFRFIILLFGSTLFFYLLPLFGDGPIWDTGLEWVTPGCKNPFVLLDNFLFINNFSGQLIKASHLRCHPFAWFLSSLFQMLIIGTIFIIFYHKKPNLRKHAIIVMLLLSLYASIAPHILFGIRPYLQIWDLETVIITLSHSFKWFHLTPNVYATSFFVGIWFGCVLNKNTYFSRTYQILFWILSVVMIVFTYLWHNSFWRLDKSAPLWSVLLWHSVGKLLFSFGLSWIFFACCTGRAGYLNKLLSWHGFQPIARLSFGIYLVHYLVVIHRVFTIRNIYIMTDKLMFEHIIVDLIFDTILAYILYILIERPFYNILIIVSNHKTVGKDEKLNNNNFTTKL